MGCNVTFLQLADRVGKQYDYSMSAPKRRKGGRARIQAFFAAATATCGAQVFTHGRRSIVGDYR